MYKDSDFPLCSSTLSTTAVTAFPKAFHTTYEFILVSLQMQANQWDVHLWQMMLPDYFPWQDCTFGPLLRVVWDFFPSSLHVTPEVTALPPWSQLGLALLDTKEGDSGSFSQQPLLRSQHHQNLAPATQCSLNHEKCERKEGKASKNMWLLSPSNIYLQMNSSDF